MLIVQDVRQERLSGVDRAAGTAMREIISRVRGDIPAVTHVDNSARMDSQPKPEPGFTTCSRRSTNSPAAR
ncbi:MAG: hypothetical protein U1G05_17760 [Kiritimatiellia bacterium]